MKYNIKENNLKANLNLKTVVIQLKAKKWNKKII